MCLSSFCETAIPCEIRKIGSCLLFVILLPTIFDMHLIIVDTSRLIECSLQSEYTFLMCNVHFFCESYLVLSLDLKSNIAVCRRSPTVSSWSLPTPARRTRGKLDQQWNIAKSTADPRVEFISQVQTQILIKFHLLNLDQTSTSKSQPNISTSIKRKLQNLDQTKLQNLDRDSTS